MKTSRKKFVLLFLAAGFAFFFIYNVVVRSVVRVIPDTADSFLGNESLDGWRNVVATILYPVKILLAGPLAPVLDWPDSPPPFQVIIFAVYWTILALVTHYVINTLTAKSQRR